MSGDRVRFSARTHVGRVRQVNEDAILALADRNVWVVSDGMGGHEAGDFASRTVVDWVALLPDGIAPADRLPAVRQALREAHRAILAEGRARGGTIGATVVAFLLADGHFGALWAGDSRLYRLRDGQADLLTSDHSTVGALVEAGQMTWDEAAHHPLANQITRAVGVGEELELDKIRGEAAPGDRFLLCSDGLNKYATVAEIGRAMQGVPIEIVADRLVQIALDGGGADNVSVIVVDIV